MTDNASVFLRAALSSTASAQISKQARPTCFAVVLLKKILLEEHPLGNAGVRSGGRCAVPHCPLHPRAG